MAVNLRNTNDVSISGVKLLVYEAAAIFVIIGLWREFIRYIDKEGH